MNIKNFILGGIAGGIADFLLGWLFYGVIFSRVLPESPTMNLTLIFLGCMSFGFIISFFWNQWIKNTDTIYCLKYGAIIGLLFGLYVNFFQWSSHEEVNYTAFAADVFISILIGAFVSLVVGLTIKLLSKS